MISRHGGRPVKHEAHGDNYCLHYVRVYFIYYYTRSECVSIFKPLLSVCFRLPETASSSTKAVALFRADSCPQSHSFSSVELINLHSFSSVDSQYYGTIALARVKTRGRAR